MDSRNDSCTYAYDSNVCLYRKGQRCYYLQIYNIELYKIFQRQGIYRCSLPLVVCCHTDNNNLSANRLPYGIYNIESKAKAQNMACAYDNISYMDKYACAYLCVAWNTPGQRHSKHNTRSFWNRYGKNNIY